MNNAVTTFTEGTDTAILKNAETSLKSANSNIGDISMGIKAYTVNITNT
jgi:hypothetical protein